MSESKPNPSGSKSFSISIMLFFMGIVAISAALYYRHQNYYLGEDLKMEELVVRDKLLFTKAVRGTKRYSFKAEVHRCTFWISQGALEVMQDDTAARSAIEQIGQGDTIEVRYRLEDKERLDDPEEKIRIIELSIHNKKVIPKEIVLQKDSLSFNIQIWLGIGCLLLVIFIRVRKYFKGIEKIDEVS